MPRRVLFTEKVHYMQFASGINCRVWAHQPHLGGPTFNDLRFAASEVLKKANSVDRPDLFREALFERLCGIEGVAAVEVTQQVPGTTEGEVRYMEW